MWLLALALLGGRVLPSALALEEVRIEQKPFEALSNRDISSNGQIALAARPAQWLHGESPHFIIHFRRITEAKRVAPDVEYYLAFVAKSLGAGPERYEKKSHVYIFEDSKDWEAFLKQTPWPQWAASLAHGDELYLNIRDARTGTFDSQTLAHETTHAVVARLYPGRHWPIWLSEGFAEEMSGQSISARMGVYNPRLGQRYQVAGMPLDDLVSVTDYPSDPRRVYSLYQTSEHLVHFLMKDNPPERFTQLIDRLATGENLDVAVTQVYPERYPDFKAFLRRYSQMPK